MFTTTINSPNIPLIIVPSWWWLILSFLAGIVCVTLAWVVCVKNKPTDLKLVLVFVSAITAMCGLVQFQTNRNVTDITTAEVIQDPEIHAFLAGEVKQFMDQHGLVLEQECATQDHIFLCDGAIIPDSLDLKTSTGQEIHFRTNIHMFNQVLTLKLIQH